MMRLFLMLTAALFAIPAGARPAGSAGANFAVGPQYDSTHVYVAPEDLDRFAISFTATFGGTALADLVEALAHADARTRQRMYRDGRTVGGVPFTKGPLACCSRTGFMSAR